MKKLWVIIFLTFFLTGCFDYQELNTRAIISGIAIDYENEEYGLGGRRSLRYVCGLRRE